MKAQKPARMKIVKHDSSWVPVQNGRGAKGRSKDYGGSAGDGSGPSVPHEDSDPEDRSSPSLPSRSHLERVLR